MTHWITEYLGTSAWGHIDQSSEICILDVRDLVDKDGNVPTVVKSKIDVALDRLQQGNKVVICCDYGMSRSNALAAGVLSAQQGISLEQAIRRVVSITGVTSIKLEVLSAVRKALGTETHEGSISETEGHRVLVTGASGFIGSSLVSELRLKHKVIAPTRQDIELLRDVINLDLLVKNERIDTIIHLANPRVYTTNYSLGDTLVMLKNVLDVCTENRLFVIYLSCWEIYSGYKARELRADEMLTPCPGGTYGQTKLLCEALMQHYHQHHGIAFTLLRSSPVYGPGSDRPKFIWNFLHKALNNEDIVAHKYFNGYPMLDMLHVDDLRIAILAALKHGVQGTINLGTGIGTSTTEVAERIGALVGSRSKIHHIEIAGYAGNIIMDIGHAAAVLGWRPTMDLAQGLESIVGVGLTDVATKMKQRSGNSE
jgi:UDP-glucuronate decarboxylase